MYICVYTCNSDSWIVNDNIAPNYYSSIIRKPISLKQTKQVRKSIDWSWDTLTNTSKFW